MRLFKIIAGVILILTGVLCFANPGATFLSMAFILGCSMLISGASGIFAYIKINGKKQLNNLILVEGLLTVILGCLVLSNQLTTDTMVPVFFGMWVMISGILRVVASLEIKKSGTNVYRWFLAPGMISIFAGIYAFLNPVLAGLLVVMLVGIFFVIQGVNVLITGINISLKK